MSASAWDRAVEAAEVKAYIASALKEIEWQVNRDCGSVWLAGEIVAHRHFVHALAAALPVLLEELAEEIKAQRKRTKDHGAYGAGLVDAEMIVRGFAAEVTQ